MTQDFLHVQDITTLPLTFWKLQKSLMCKIWPFAHTNINFRSTKLLKNWIFRNSVYKLKRGWGLEHFSDIRLWSMLLFAQVSDCLLTFRYSWVTSTPVAFAYSWKLLILPFLFSCVSCSCGQDSKAEKFH